LRRLRNGKKQGDYEEKREPSEGSSEAKKKRTRFLVGRFCGRRRRMMRFLGTRGMVGKLRSLGKAHGQCEENKKGKNPKNHPLIHYLRKRTKIIFKGTGAG